MTAKRMKAVASERERIRARTRSVFSKSEKDRCARPKRLVSRWWKTSTDQMAGCMKPRGDKAELSGSVRGHAPTARFLFTYPPLAVSRSCFVGAVLYVFVIAKSGQGAAGQLRHLLVGAASLGLQAPLLLMKNAISKRQLSIKRAFPRLTRPAADLRVPACRSSRVIARSRRNRHASPVALSEEFALTTAELSYLRPQRGL